MIKKIGLIVLTTAIGLLIQNCVFAKGTQLAPDFKLSALNNGEVSLSSYKDKPLIIFFWTTWCPFCRKELKVLSDMQEQISKDGVQILGINVGEPQGKVDSFLKNSNINLPMLLDEDSAAATAYGLLGVPTYVLVDSKGYILQQSHTFPKEEYKELLSK